MFCPYCGSFAPDGSPSCGRCKGRFPNAPASAKNAELPEVPPKKGRLWPPLLALVIIFAVGLSLFAAIRLSSTTVTDAAAPWFTLQDGVLYFDESLYSGSEELVVPAYICGQAVTAISDNCFAGCSWLTTAEIPEGIEHIGERAFAYCTALRGMLLPESLQSIGDEAYSGCVALEAICIPYGAQDLGTGIFRNCVGLRHIFYPGPVEDWNALDIGSLGPQTRIYCADGVATGG